MARLRVVVLFVAGAVIAASFVATVWSVGHLRGQPQYDAAIHHYVLDIHGQLLLITRQKYNYYVAVQNRLFLSIAVIGTTVPAVLALAKSRPE
jgi:hypothetical protein